MGKIVAIHQPNYVPWIGFFRKMALADIFVILDTVQFSKDSYTQRTKIRTKEGWIWLTIPVEKKYYFRPIKEVGLPENSKWMKKHKIALISNYAKAPFFDKNFIEQYYCNEFTKLREFNEFGIFYLKEKFGIRTEVVRASELGINKNLKSTELLIEIVKQVGGAVYISGMGGKRYIEEEKFERESIKIKYFEFKHFEYLQRWEGFEPYMAAIDLLFNIGDKSKHYI